MKHIYKIIFSLFCVILVLFIFTSCEEWLDVKPKTEINSDELFETENGFKEALAGIYTGMSNYTLYGKELTFGLSDAMSQQWMISRFPPPHEYLPAMQFNFEAGSSKSKVLGIWKSAYNVIANINSLLDNIDSRKSVFLGDNYNIIKGEALALRAYLHFDMLRLFGSVDFTDGEKEYIPYVNSLVAGITKKDNPKKIVEKALSDLKIAAELFVNDPIKAGIKSEDAYFVNRNFHMNYYAVKGLMARIYLYIGNKELAFNAANEVILAHKEGGLFPWIKSEDITRSEKEKRDRTFSTEHLFALNIMNLKNYIKDHFKSETANFGMRVLYTTPVSLIYEKIEEYRATYLFENEGYYTVPSKLWQEESKEPGLPKKNRMPMLRLSEMYYIAAEAKMDNPTLAIEYLNEVRRHRAINTDLMLGANIILEIEKEYKKEFVCEGQLFFFYKRLKRSTIGTTPIKSYIVPIPEVEDEYRGN